ncbi:MAG: GNAT family N-acetyltransferase [Chitinophagales bacterium]
MTKITLRHITRELFRPCVRLSVTDDQKKFVAGNLYSLAQAKTNPLLHPFAIYGEEVIGRSIETEDEMRGFVMYQVMDGVGFIMRLMVDQRFQGQGYGTAAMKEVIRRLQMNPETEFIATSVHKENPRTLEFYKRLGFTIFIEEKKNEIYLKLDWYR